MSQRTLEVDNDSPDTHPAQIPDRMALLVQPEWAKFHHLPLKDCAVDREKFLAGLRDEIEFVCDTAVHIPLFMITAL